MTVSLRPMTAQDKDLIYKWQTSPGAREFCRNPAAPSYEEHSVWIEQALADPDRHNFIIEYKDNPVGILRLDQRQKKVYEISILIDKNYSNKGIASHAISLAEDKFEDCTIEAEILSRNKASLIVFQKNGYKHRNNDWYVKKLKR